MEEFCLGIFAKADKADRESPSQPPDLSIAGKFYVSSLFFDVLTQFYPDRTLPPDLHEMRRYAKYRTIQIRNREPLESEKKVDPGPAGAVYKPAPLPDKKVPAQSSGFKYRDEEEEDIRPPPVKPSVVTAGPVPVVARGETNVKNPLVVSRADAMAAKKKLQQAVSAIEFSDYQTAVIICHEVTELLSQTK